jgi:L-asparaginase
MHLNFSACERDNMMKQGKTTILIIYTGGTIGMANDPRTGTLIPVDFNNLAGQVPELRKFGYNIRPVSFDPVTDSSNIDPGMWLKMAEKIEDNYENFDGCVILHGTDTMAWSASALSFILENLDKPVIFTGSQLPVGVLRTDGKENLITAIEIAASKENGLPVVPEVCIYFDSKLMRGNRTTKLSSDHFNAFSSPNFPPLADVGLHIKYYRNYILKPASSGSLSVNKMLDTNVAILKIFPGIGKNLVESILNTKGLRGLVIETFGSGNAPTYPWLIEEISRFINNGGIVLNVTQCQSGSVEMGMYETSRALLASGVISGRDLTTEAAVTKMMYLLGHCSDRNEVISKLNGSMAGEITF